LTPNAEALAMRTDRLRTNQLSPEAYRWYIDYLGAMDRKDLDAYGAFLADDCALRMNNQPPTAGKHAVLRGLDAYWRSFGTIEHDLDNIYGDDRRFALEALNHYTRLDGAAVTLRAVAFTDRDDAGLVTSVRLYTDTGPLFAPGG
jgi:ketosteroid isomerase-like protein